MNYDQFIAALCLWREARNCADEVLTGIWWVLLNRVRDRQQRWPRTIPGVVLQHAQFSSFLQSDPNVTKFPINNGSADWAAWDRCRSVVSNSLGDDPTGGATNYYDVSISAPSWADPSKFTVQLGSIKFYKL